ncbi:hypothetical protein CALVIDRAFT_285392 [Calocera viscosa TUFC12733]|uniref:C2 NT-type domain-containing protein n=1 Tax=Calocera viscosa (strain TUFC12733) TaxID=1330018 RepID=A0A167IUD0_CALVF|nr:hypothetical protein CALVIDRAFT_285392 [Calocera viscosa TUFC12733]
MAASAPPSESQMPLRSTYIFSGVTVLDVPARPLRKSIGKYFVTIEIDGKEEWKSREIQTRERKVVWNQKEDKCEFESASSSTWKVTLCKNHSRSKPVEEMGSITLPLDGWMQRFMVAQLLTSGNDELAMTVQMSIAKKEVPVPNTTIVLEEPVAAAGAHSDDAAVRPGIAGLGAASAAVDEVVRDAGDVVGALNGLLGKLHPFTTLMDKVSEVHPFLKMSCTILSTALKVVSPSVLLFLR